MNAGSLDPEAAGVWLVRAEDAGFEPARGYQPNTISNSNSDDSHSASSGQTRWSGTLTPDGFDG